MRGGVVMTKRAIVSVSALVILTLAACQQPAPPAGLSEQDRAAIDAMTEAWLLAARSSDWEAAAATYADDAVLLPPNEPAVQGRAAIKAWFEAFPPIGHLDIQVVEVEGIGDLAYVRGTYQMTIAVPDMEPLTDTGKFLDIRRRQPDGRWLYVQDMFSSDLPAPAGS